MVEKDRRWVIVGTVNGGGWECTKKLSGKLLPEPARWNAVSAHMDWIEKVIKGSKVEMCNKT